MFPKGRDTEETSREEFPKLSLPGCVCVCLSADDTEKREGERVDVRMSVQVFMCGSEKKDDFLVVGLHEPRDSG